MHAELIAQRDALFAAGVRTFDHGHRHPPAGARSSGGTFRELIDPSLGLRRKRMGGGLKLSACRALERPDLHSGLCVMGLDADEPRSCTALCAESI
jgi:hypothetical protein